MEDATSVLTTSFLVGTNVYLPGPSAEDSEKISQIKTLERLILSIASVQYGVAWKIEDRGTLMRWRSLDWILTTPMLLKTFHSLAEEKGFTGSFVPVFFLDILMIYTGYHAEFITQTEQEKWSWYMLGMACLLGIFYYVYQWDTYLRDVGVDTKNLATFFYVGWTAYGANFMNPDPELRQVGFNVLDLVNKGLYSLQLNSVLNEL